MKIKGL